MTPASLQEQQSPQQCLLDGTFTEEDMQVIDFLENSMKRKENKTKLEKKKSMHRKAGVTAEREKETLYECYKEEQDTSIFSDSFSSIRKKKELRKRTAIESNENCLPLEMNNANNSQTPDHLKSPFKAKKSKKKKKQMPEKIQPPNSSPSSTEVHQNTAVNINGGKTRKSSNKEATIDSKNEATSRNDVGISHQRKKPPLALHQSNIDLCNRTPLSSPATLPKKKRQKAKPSKSEDMNGMSEHSQDLFITQKKFVSSHGSSECSPPLGQKQGSGLQGWLRSQKSPQLFSQFSCFTRDSLDCSSNRKKVLREMATQTDDSFTFLALMSFVKKVKVLDPCSEEALDLCLPSRIRAKRDVLSASDDVIILESLSTPVDPNALKNGKLKFLFSSSQKARETKFVQTILNSSYFFKGKGEIGEATPIPPLLKGKEKPKKRSRRSGGLTKKEAKATK